MQYPVSYTHLDVYKRQRVHTPCIHPRFWRQGIVFLDKPFRSIPKDGQDVYKRQRLGDSNILAMFKDSKQHIWIGTKQEIIQLAKNADGKYVKQSDVYKRQHQAHPVLYA